MAITTTRTKQLIETSNCLPCYRGSKNNNNKSENTIMTIKHYTAVCTIYIHTYVHMYIHIRIL